MLNKVQLIGRLGGQPETASTQGGTPVTKLSLATSESFTDKQTGQKREDTEWHRIVMFGRLAEIAGQYLTKGDLVFLEGKIKTREWEKDGVKRWTTEIVANEMKMLGNRSEGGRQPAGNGQQQQQRQQQRQSAQAQVPPQQQGGNFDSFPDDDIPF